MPSYFRKCNGYMTSYYSSSLLILIRHYSKIFAITVNSLALMN